VRIALAALVILFGLGSAVAAADDGWVIESFASDVTIQPDASLRVTEAIDVDFGQLQRHGIIRRIPVRYRWDDTHVRVYRLAVGSVTDGRARPIKFETSTDGAYVAIKIGDALTTGRQSYRIAYEVAGAMNAFSDHDELFWNVNGGEWEVPTRRVSAIVRVPGGLQKTTCFQGRAGSREACQVSTAGNLAQFTATRELAPAQQLTIVAAVAKGAVAAPAPMIERDVDNPLAYFEVDPGRLALAVFVLVAGLAFLFSRWYGFGRDLRQRATIVPEYEPPDALRPAQVGLLLDESADKKDVTATIVDLAVRGYLTINEEPASGLFAKKDWTLSATEKGADELAPFERTIHDGLFGISVGRSVVRREVKVSGLKTTFASSLHRAQDQLYQDSADRRWFPRRPDRVRQSYAGLSLLTLLAGAGLAWLLGRAAGAGFVGVAVAVVGLIAVPAARVMPAKTAAGAELLRRALGFRRYMEVAEADRQRFAERENIFSAYLPYAIVFGCVDRWARAFKDIDTTAQTASWYAGAGQFDSGALSSSLQGFSADLGSAIAATAGSSGGSGFSGGGGAGGGGGGGGGSSW
jgi:uncharacterized membrane protein YgcG